MTKRKGSFFSRHSLSITSAAIVALWISLYRASNPSTHWGAFFGNAIADWTGMLVTVLATKFMYEKGSSESRKPPDQWWGPLHKLFMDHSLSIFLVVTGALWVYLFARMDSESKWGQVVGNIVSEWTQIFGLVILTKKLLEKGSKESSRK